MGPGFKNFDEVFLSEIFLVWMNYDKGERSKAKGRWRFEVRGKNDGQPTTYNIRLTKHNMQQT